MPRSFTAPVASFATIAGGCWIEETGADRLASDRCFRFDAEGRAEFAYFGDLEANGERARWYGHQFKMEDFILC